MQFASSGTFAGGIRKDRPGRLKISMISRTSASVAWQIADKSRSEVGLLVPRESEKVSVSALKIFSAAFFRSSVPVSS